MPQDDNQGRVQHDKPPEQPTVESIALRMARAIDAAMPLIKDMWGHFPNAEQHGDEEVMSELRSAAADFWRHARARRGLGVHSGL